MSTGPQEHRRRLEGHSISLEASTAEEEQPLCRVTQGPALLGQVHPQPSHPALSRATRRNPALPEWAPSPAPPSAPPA